MTPAAITAVFTVPRRINKIDLFTNASRRGLFSGVYGGF